MLDVAVVAVVEALVEVALVDVAADELGVLDDVVMDVVEAARVDVDAVVDTVLLAAGVFSAEHPARAATASTANPTVALMLRFMRASVPA